MPPVFVPRKFCVANVYRAKCVVWRRAFISRNRALKPLTTVNAAAYDSVAVDGDAERFDRIAQALCARLEQLADSMDVGQFSSVAADEIEFDYEDLLAGDSGSNQAPEKAESSRSKRRGRSIAPRKQLPVDLLPKVAIIGRPNVGKSALFNRIAGRTLAIVYDTPGVTRDRLYTRAFWGNREFLLIDTGGLMADATKLPVDIRDDAMKSISADGLPSAIERQAAAGVSEADAVILVTDGQEGTNATDLEILEWLRKTHSCKPVILAVNKCESPQQGLVQAAAFWEYGMEPFAVSAISGTGTGDLLEQLMQALPPAVLAEEVEAEEPVSIAIIGRPNVGKSSLLNAITGQNRAIVSSMSGTTRDAVDTDITLPDGTKLKLIDTAGIRKRAAVASSKDGAESLSVDRAIRALRRADVVVHVLSATEGVTTQDYRLAELAAAEGCAVVIVINKWDQLEEKTDKTLREYTDNVRGQLRPIEWANIVSTSAVTGQRVKRVVEACLAAAEQHRRRISTATLNLVLQEATAWRSPPSMGTKKARIYYATQATTKPPTFVLFCNDPKLFSDDYKRYMERQIRQNAGLEGTSLRLYWRGKDGSARTRPA